MHRTYYRNDFALRLRWASTPERMSESRMEVRVFTLPYSPPYRVEIPPAPEQTKGIVREGDSIIILADSHRLPPGEVKVTTVTDTPDADSPDGWLRSSYAGSAPLALTSDAADSCGSIVEVTLTRHECGTPFPPVPPDPVTPPGGGGCDCPQVRSITEAEFDAIFAEVWGDTQTP